MVNILQNEKEKNIETSYRDELMKLWETIVIYGIDENKEDIGIIYQNKNLRPKFHQHIRKNKREIID